MTDTAETSIRVHSPIEAPVERVFALLADPDRHPDLDASGMVRASETHLAITELGDVFTMKMEHPTMGEYTTENHVVVYEPDRAIGWAPASPGERPAGHTYVWTMEPTGDEQCELTQTYDWSAVTDENLLPYFPVSDRAQLQESLRLVAEALA